MRFSKDDLFVYYYSAPGLKKRICQRLVKDDVLLCPCLELRRQQEQTALIKHISLGNLGKMVPVYSHMYTLCILVKLKIFF